MSKRSEALEVDKRIQRAYVKYVVLVLAIMCLFFVAILSLNK